MVFQVQGRRREHPAVRGGLHSSSVASAGEQKQVAAAATAVRFKFVRPFAEAYAVTAQKAPGCCCNLAMVQGRCTEWSLVVLYCGFLVSHLAHATQPMAQHSAAVS